MLESPAPAAVDPQVQAGFDTACRLLEQLADQTARDDDQNGARIARTLLITANLLRKWRPYPFWEQPGYEAEEET